MNIQSTWSLKEGNVLESFFVIHLLYTIKPSSPIIDFIFQLFIKSIFSLLLPLFITIISDFSLYLPPNRGPHLLPQLYPNHKAVSRESFLYVESTNSSWSKLCLSLLPSFQTFTAPCFTLEQLNFSHNIIPYLVFYLDSCCCLFPPCYL